MKIATNANRSSFFMHANYFEQRQPKKKKWEVLKPKKRLNIFNQPRVWVRVKHPKRKII